MDKILHEARAERLFPGQGGLDLSGLLAALPHDLPLSLEVPTVTLAARVAAVDRARQALAATRALLARQAAPLDPPPVAPDPVGAPQAAGGSA